MIICDICGTKNLSTDNFCIHCGNRLRLGEIKDWDSFFTDYNLISMAKYDFSKHNYDKLLANTFNPLKYLNLSNKSIKDKIITIARVFGIVSPKSSGYVRGKNRGYIIYYDDRLDDSIQIATIIHELSHCLLFTFFVNLVCDMLKVKSSIIIESFVWYSLTYGEMELFNEFFAHTVEGRFLPRGYQDYSSFKTLFSDGGYTADEIKDFVRLANSLAQDFISYLELTIDEDLRKEISIQYKKDFIEKKYDDLFFEDYALMSSDEKNSLLHNLLVGLFKEAFSEDIRLLLLDIELDFR